MDWSGESEDTRINGILKRLFIIDIEAFPTFSFLQPIQRRVSKRSGTNKMNEKAPVVFIFMEASEDRAPFMIAKTSSMEHPHHVSITSVRVGGKLFDERCHRTLFWFFIKDKESVWVVFCMGVLAGIDVECHVS